MSMSARVVLVLLAGFAVAVGCASAGRDFGSQAALGIEVGGDTRESVFARLGPPRTHGPVPKGARPGCIDRWVYRYARYGLFSDSIKVLVVDFDSAGLVCYRGYSED